jgi:hypothetical protein
MDLACIPKSLGDTSEVDPRQILHGLKAVQDDA